MNYHDRHKKDIMSPVLKAQPNSPTVLTCEGFSDS